MQSKIAIHFPDGREFAALPEQCVRAIQAGSLPPGSTVNLGDARWLSINEWLAQVVMARGNSPEGASGHAPTLICHPPGGREFKASIDQLCRAISSGKLPDQATVAVDGSEPMSLQSWLLEASGLSQQQSPEKEPNPPQTYQSLKDSNPDPSQPASLDENVTDQAPEPKPAVSIPKVPAPALSIPQVPAPTDAPAPAPNPDFVGGLKELHVLRQQGALSEAEFRAAKARILGPNAPPTQAEEPDHWAASMMLDLEEDGEPGLQCDVCGLGDFDHLEGECPNCLSRAPYQVPAALACALIVSEFILLSVLLLGLNVPSGITFGIVVSLFFASCVGNSVIWGLSRLTVKYTTWLGTWVVTYAASVLSLIASSFLTDLFTTVPTDMQSAIREMTKMGYLGTAMIAASLIVGAAIVYRVQLPRAVKAYGLPALLMGLWMAFWVYNMGATVQRFGQGYGF